MVYYLDALQSAYVRAIAEYLAISALHIRLDAPGQGIDADISVPCFTFSKVIGRPPQEIARDLSASLSLRGVFRLDSAGGYLNIWLDPSALAGGIRADFASGRAYGTYDVGAGKIVISEFPSLNMAKPYSVGHLRPALQGWAVYKLMTAMGYRVVRDNHLGDYGTPFGKWAVGFYRYSSEQALAKRGVYELADVYIKVTEDLKREKETGVSELADQAQDWLLRLENEESEAVNLSERFNKLSLDHMHAVLTRMRIETDEELGESFYVKEGQTMVDQLLADGRAEVSEGAVIVRLNEYGIKTPMVLRKSNGAALYATSDMATLKYRAERWHPTKVIHHVGGEQQFYFQQLFALAKKLGYEDIEFVHVWHGMIDQVSQDGTREKMSSRRGVILLEELLDVAEQKAAELLSDRSESNAENVRKVALGAVKFNDFARDIRTGILFDWDSIFSLHGRSGPYVQYAAVRISSILAKLGTANVNGGESGYGFEAERSLLRMIAQYPQAVREAAEGYQPYKVAAFLYDLAHEWNGYYERVSILHSEGPALSGRVEVLRMLYYVFEHGLDLLGIEVPSRM